MNIQLFDGFKSNFNLILYFHVSGYIESFFRFNVFLKKILILLKYKITQFINNVTT